MYFDNIYSGLKKLTLNTIIKYIYLHLLKLNFFQVLGALFLRMNI